MDCILTGPAAISSAVSTGDWATHAGSEAALLSVRAGARAAGGASRPLPDTAVLLASHRCAPAPGPMSLWLDCLYREDPVALDHASHLALTRLLRSHRRGKPIRRLWIDHPYGEEEITLLEEELIPAMEQFLARIQEIDVALEAAHEAEIERVQAAIATEPLAVA